MEIKESPYGTIYIVHGHGISKEIVKQILFTVKDMGKPVFTPHELYIYSGIPRRTIGRGLFVLVELKKLTKMKVGHYEIVPSVYYNIGIDGEKIVV
jgi:hypothetical protein